MTPEEVTKVIKTLEPICDQLSDLIEYVRPLDGNLDRHLTKSWVSLIQVYWSGLKRLGDVPGRV